MSIGDVHEGNAGNAPFVRWKATLATVFDIFQKMIPSDHAQPMEKEIVFSYMDAIQVPGIRSTWYSQVCWVRNIVLLHCGWTLSCGLAPSSENHNCSAIVSRLYGNSWTAKPWKNGFFQLRFSIALWFVILLRHFAKSFWNWLCFIFVILKTDLGLAWQENGPKHVVPRKDTFAYTFL